MKTIKIGMLAAAAVLMVLTGCKNSFAPTKPADDAFAAHVSEIAMSGVKSFKVSTITQQSYGDTEGKKLRVAVEFNKSVTKAGVKGGISFYKLADATYSWEKPSMTPLTVADADMQVEGTTAYVTLNVDGVKHLYVKVEAAQVKAEDGSFLNQDTDEKWQEKHDDDYAQYFQLDNMNNLKGNYDFMHKSGAMNETLSSMLTPVFATGKDSKQYLKQSVKVNAAQFNTLLAAVDGTNAAYTDSDKTALRESVRDILNKHLKVEWYDWSKSVWENATLAFTYVDIKDDPATSYVDEAYQGWVSSVELPANHQVRFKWVNVKDISVTLSKTYGYPLKYQLNDTSAESREITTSAVDSGTDGFTNRIWPNDKVTVNKTENGFVTITLTDLDSVSFDDAVYADKVYYDVTLANKDTGKKSLFAGFDTSAADKDYFKCLDSDSNELAIDHVSRLQTNVQSYPLAYDQLIIYLKDKSVRANSVYISPTVKTQKFTGSYRKGVEMIAAEVEALPLASITAPNDVNVLGGWLKK